MMERDRTMPLKMGRGLQAQEHGLAANRAKKEEEGIILSQPPGKFQSQHLDFSKANLISNF